MAMVPLPAACACSEGSRQTETDSTPACACCVPAPSESAATESTGTSCCGGTPGQPCDCPDCHAGEFAPLAATTGELRAPPQLVDSPLLDPAFAAPTLSYADIRRCGQQVYHVRPGPQFERLCRWLI